MNEKTKQYTIDLEGVNWFPEIGGKTLEDRLNKMGYNETSHIFSSYDALGMKDAKYPPANYRIDPTEEFKPLNKYKFEGKNVDRETAVKLVNEKMKKFQNEANRFKNGYEVQGNEKYWNLVELINECKNDHPDRVDEIHKQKFEVLKGAFFDDEIPYILTYCNDFKVPEISIWNKNDLIKNRSYDGFSEGYRAKNTNIVPDAIVKLQNISFDE